MNLLIDSFRKAIFMICLSTLTLRLAGQVNSTSSYKLFFEKVYLHTDREQYTGGEDVWFKAYLVNAQDNKLFSSSNNLYAELINADLKIVDRKTLRINNGLGNGDFKLPDSIPPGTWRIRAYTNWMRNFGDNFVFEKQIQVFSEAPKMKPELRTQSRYKGVNRKFDEPAQLIDTAGIRKSIRFLPEGGSMTQLVPGLVAFKTDDGYGNSVGIKGTIETLSGEVVATIVAENGMGSFLLTPLSGERYIAKITFSDGQELVTQLPRPLLIGLTMAATSMDSSVTITIRANENTLSDLRGKMMMLLIKSKGRVVFRKDLVIDEISKAVIPKNILPAGINSITLIDPSRRPQAERLVFIDEQNPVTLSIQSDKESYGSKEKIFLTLKATDKNGLPVKTNLSVAVTDASLASDNVTDIVSYLGIQSEIRGRIDHPGRYFDPENPGRKEQLDLLMLTQGWRDFTWKRIADSAIRLSYTVEQGMTLSGRVRRLWVDRSMDNININFRTFTTTAARDIKYTSGIYHTLTDSLGNFYIDKIELYGRQLIKLTSLQKKGKRAGILEEDSVIVKPMNISRLSINPWPDTEKQAALNYSLEHEFEERKKQSLSDTLTLKAVAIIRTDPNKKLAMPYAYLITEKFRKSYDNLTHFLMGECSDCRPDYRSYLAFTNVDFSFRGWVGKGPQNGGTLTLPMTKIASVKMQPYYGSRGFRVSVTVNVRADAFEENYNVKYFYVNGYYQTREFFAPKYEAESAKSDKRTTIHWAPDIITGENGEATLSYYNADPKTKVRIVAEGVSNNGIPLMGSLHYEVKYPAPFIAE